MKNVRMAVFASLALGLSALVCRAEETKAPDAAAPAASAPAAAGTEAPAATAPTADPKISDNPPEVEMTAEERAERDARKACKVEICSAFRNKKADGPDISCPVIKSWRKEALNKLVGRLKVSWPYGKIHCSSTVKLNRADLVKAMTEDKFQSLLGKHEVACTVEREKDVPSEIKFDFSPAVTFEKGKAIKAKINWGKIEAPSLIKTALWTATAADNTVNILSSTLVEDINDFIDKRCDEVKADWQGK